MGYTSEILRAMGLEVKRVMYVDLPPVINPVRDSNMRLQIVEVYVGASTLEKDILRIKESLRGGNGKAWSLKRVGPRGYDLRVTHTSTYERK